MNPFIYVPDSVFNVAACCLDWLVFLGTCFLALFVFCLIVGGLGSLMFFAYRDLRDAYRYKAGARKIFD